MNTVIMIGRLTKDGELRFIPGSGKPVISFTIAVNRQFKNKEGKYEADFFNVVLYGKLAEILANDLVKGKQVAIKGSIQNRSYTTQNNEKRYITEINADTIEILGKREHREGGPSFEPTGLDPEGFQALDDDDIPF